MTHISITIDRSGSVVPGNVFITGPYPDSLALLTDVIAEMIDVLSERFADHLLLFVISAESILIGANVDFGTVKKRNHLIKHLFHESVCLLIGNVKIFGTPSPKGQIGPDLRKGPAVPRGIDFRGNRYAADSCNNPEADGSDPGYKSRLQKQARESSSSQAETPDNWERSCRLNAGVPHSS